MSLYNRLCMASTAVSFSTVGILLWTSTIKSDSSYIYLSLAAPTLVLSHHLLYFLLPFTSTKAPVYTFVSSTTSDPEAPIDVDATPATNARVSRLYRGYVTRWQYLFNSVHSIYEEQNPMASSTTSIIVLIFLAVLVGAFAMSAGAVVVFDSIDSLSLEKSNGMMEATAFELSPEFSQGSGANATAPASMDAIIQPDLTIPPIPILVLQASLSFAQAFLLGALAVVGLRIRSMFSNNDEENEPMWDLEWVYEDDELCEEDK